MTYADLTRGEIEVPLIPEAATAVMRACADPDTDARKLTEIIRRDAALATGVVRVAQSAVYGGVRVATLQQAVTRLGAVKLREAAWVVVATTVRSALPAAEDAPSSPHPAAMSGARQSRTAMASVRGTVMTWEHTEDDSR